MKKPLFQNKVAIITGSSRGIGRATAFELVKEGVNVVLNGRNSPALEKAVNAMPKQGGRVLPVQADVTSIDDCSDLINRTLDHFGGIDIFIANAGIAMRGRFEALNPDVFRNTINLNVLGSIYSAQLALPHLRKSKGSLLFISTVAGLRGLPNISIYGASKMCLTGIAESLAFELQDTGVHVGIVYVGFTRNDAGKKILGEDGNLISLGPRNTGFVQSQEETARGIIQALTKKKHRTVLSPLGKLNAFSIRFFPVLSARMISSYLKRDNSMYK